MAWRFSRFRHADWTGRISRPTVGAESFATSHCQLRRYRHAVLLLTGEESMADTNSNPEATAIEEAYHDRIGSLFNVLATNLGDMPVTHRTEQQCVEMFKAGFNNARKARQLALVVVAAAP